MVMACPNWLPLLGPRPVDYHNHAGKLVLDHAAGCSPFLLRGPKALVAERGSVGHMIHSHIAALAHLLGKEYGIDGIEYVSMFVGKTNNISFWRR